MTKNKIYNIGKKSKMKYHLNKKEILFWANKIRIYLKLPPIKINIMKILYPTSNHDLFSFDPVKVEINLGQPSNTLIMDSLSDNFYKLNIYNSKEILIFSIFHEIAHYFQFYYYNKWFNFFATDEKYYYFDGNHCDKHLEKNADKIALILFKKLYLNQLQK